MAKGDGETAVHEFEGALVPPRSLGESKHPLANQSDIHYWAGVARAAVGDIETAEAHWRAAAEFKGDFLGMEVRSFSEKTYYSALSKRKLGEDAECDNILDNIRTYAEALLNKRASIDYFATSLPTMLIFEDDIQQRQDISAYIMLSQVHMARGAFSEAEDWLLKVRQKRSKPCLCRRPFGGDQRRGLETKRKKLSNVTPSF